MPKTLTSQDKQNTNDYSPLGAVVNPVFTVQYKTALDDGKTLLSGSENGGRIRIWSLVTGKQIGSFTPPLPKKEDMIGGGGRASAPITLAVSNYSKD